MLNSMKELFKIAQKVNYILCKKHKCQAVLVVVLSTLGAMLETLGVAVIVPFIQALVSPDILKTNKFGSYFISKFEITSDTMMIVIIAVFIVMIYIMKNLYLIWLSYFKIKYQNNVQREISIRLMNSYMSRPYLFFTKINSSLLIRSIYSDVVGVYLVLTAGFTILAELLTAAGIALCVFATDWLMAIIIIAFIGICSLLIMIPLKRKLKAAGNSQGKYEALTYKCLSESFGGIKEILVMQRQEYFRKKYSQYYDERFKASIVFGIASQSPNYYIEVICVCGLILAVCVKLVLGTDKTIFISRLAVLALAAFRLLPSVSRIISGLNSIIYYNYAVNTIYSNIQEIENDAPMIEEMPMKRETQQIDVFNERLTLQNIVWTYSDTQEPVLDKINLNINKGRAVAFVGSSGAGKSTLADIILGLLVPQSGKMLIDGKDVTGRLADCSLIGYVPQTVFLADDSIRKNVAFGVEEEQIDNDRVWSVLSQAKIDQYIKELPEGIETMVGERGIRFSGGQRQRIAIARALYNMPEILVLDEATSALDTETEQAVMESIEELHGKKTLIIIAHRLSTIEKCDEVFEVAGGMLKKVR